jgi:hypothetical protein
MQSIQVLLCKAASTRQIRLIYQHVLTDPCLASSLLAEQRRFFHLAAHRQTLMMAASYQSKSWMMMNTSMLSVLREEAKK